MELEFNDASELFARLKPALKSKVFELQKQGYEYLEMEDIWNYLKEIKWKKVKNLSLNEMVSDIFSCDGLLIDDYFKNKLKGKRRKIYFESEDESWKNYGVKFYFY